MPIRPPEQVDVQLNLKIFSVTGTWRPNKDERQAAWELYVELITRVSVVPLEYGHLREALASIYSLFATSRDILRRYGPVLAEPKPEGQYSLGYLVVVMLNTGIRPVLSYWHPQLEDWEAGRPSDSSRAAHEANWPRANELRAALGATREVLQQYADLLAHVCGIPRLHDLSLGQNN